MGCEWGLEGPMPPVRQGLNTKRSFETLARKTLRRGLTVNVVFICCVGRKSLQGSWVKTNQKRRQMDSQTRLLKALVCAFTFLLGARLAWGSVGGIISGLVKDPSGAVVTGAEVVATNAETGVKSSAKTDSAGFYSFSTLTLGRHQVEIKQTGFKLFLATDLVIDANTVLRVDATLELGLVTSAEPEDLGKLL